MSPDFHEIVGDAGSESEGLRTVHELLSSVDPPPELTRRLRRPPRVRTAAARPRMALALGFVAAAVAAALVGGYAVGHSGSFEAAYTRPMHAVGPSSQARAVLRIGGRDAAGNRTLKMTVHALPALPNGGWYALNLTNKGKAVLLCGTFQTGVTGAVKVSMNLPSEAAEYDGWNVTAVVPGHLPQVRLTT